jgi:hypothetical protein
MSDRNPKIIYTEEDAKTMNAEKPQNMDEAGVLHLTVEENEDLPIVKSASSTQDPSVGGALSEEEQRKFLDLMQQQKEEKGKIKNVFEKPPEPIMPEISSLSIKPQPKLEERRPILLAPSEITAEGLGIENKAKKRKSTKMLIIAGLALACVMVIIYSVHLSLSPFIRFVTFRWEKPMQLSATVEYGNAFVLLRNNDDFDWTTCQLRLIGSAEVAYLSNRSSIPQQTETQLSYVEFVSRDGQKLQPGQEIKQYLTVNCVIKDKKALWSGNMVPQKK